MYILQHPLWLVGFRPLFALTMLAGLCLPGLWVLMLSGLLANAGLIWHAHEMFYGFGWALMAGFLLTASKNWLAIRGYHGGALLYLVAMWLLERLSMALGTTWPKWLQSIGLYAFLVSVVGMLLYSLLRYRRQDSFSDNWLFILALPLFLLAKYALLHESYWWHGVSMSLALFRLVLLIMLERTQSQFMRAAFNVDILRQPHLDMGIKLLALLLVAESWLPSSVGIALNLALGLSLLGRFLYWQPGKAFTRMDIAVMYFGYLAIMLQVLLNAWSAWHNTHWVGSVSIHLFTLGALSVMAPAMIIRISKGHTGRRVMFDRIDKLSLWCMIVATLLRLVLPQFFPATYLYWLAVAALCWLLGFASLAVRYIPVLLAPRQDGRIV